jgi:hypothetical protein
MSEAEGKQHERRCPHCDAPIYVGEAGCHYCAGAPGQRRAKVFSAVVLLVGGAAAAGVIAARLLR